MIQNANSLKEIAKVGDTHVFVTLPMCMPVQDPDNPEETRFPATVDLLRTPEGRGICIATIRAELEALVENFRGFGTVIPKTRTAFRYLDKAIKALEV